jgi:hypothetical protein
MMRSLPPTFLRMSLKWLPETREWRVRVLEYTMGTATVHSEYFSGAGITRQSKASAWWDAMATAYDVATRLGITLPEDWGIQAPVVEPKCTECGLPWPRCGCDDYDRSP